MTVNELLVLNKIIRERLNELKNLRNTVAIKTSWMLHDKEKQEEPQYDVKLVDTKIVELQNFLFRSDAAIKQSNAKTKVDFEADVGNLLKPLE